MIFKNAKDVPLGANPGTLPNMSDALDSWMVPMVFINVVKTQVNFRTLEAGVPINFQGVWQPLDQQQVNMKPQGQREWKWFQVHAQTGLILLIDQVITYQGVQYRVRGRWDYNEYGYVNYHLVQDYTGSGPTEVTP